MKRGKTTGRHLDRLCTPKHVGTASSEQAVTLGELLSSLAARCDTQWVSDGYRDPEDPVSSDPLDEEIADLVGKPTLVDSFTKATTVLFMNAYERLLCGHADAAKELWTRYYAITDWLQKPSTGSDSKPDLTVALHRRFCLSELNSLCLNLARELRAAQGGGIESNSGKKPNGGQVALAGEADAIPVSTGGREKPWDNALAGFIFISKARKKYCDGPTVPTLAVLGRDHCKSDGEFDYMRKGQRRKVHEEQFAVYAERQGWTKAAIARAKAFLSASETPRTSQAKLRKQWDMRPEDYEQ